MTAPCENCLKLLDKIETLREQVKKLRVFYDSFPKTKDGVVALRGMEVWHPYPDNPNNPFVVGEDGYFASNREEGDDTSKCFASRRLARKFAKENPLEGGPK